MLAVLLALGAARGRVPYVDPIEVEEGSLEGVAVEITSAEESEIMAQGYEKWGIRGKRIYIEATADNISEEVREFTVTFSARDIFGAVIATCDKRWGLRPGEQLRFECVLQVNDLRKFNNITYIVTPRPPLPLKTR